MSDAERHCIWYYTLRLVRHRLAQILAPAQQVVNPDYEVEKVLLLIERQLENGTCHEATLPDAPRERPAEDLGSSGFQ